ncbi:TBC1 domain family member 22B-like [Malaya genurostris]|uniref:TBC1 domain family member 22B-like n=1 Tax=Malaya genurostris TaxID=325434 RepID=UPI0026F3ED67|nr:TBC1 domain family member 22B-like [Malaya genurostris]XP_058458790.1 TBC1 domain family member 22B-like [Malaya genurostris]
MNSSSSDTGSSFWKNNSTRIPGRPTMATRMVPGGGVRSGPGGSASSAGSSSFQDYQESVSDAWDLGDDEFCIISNVVDTPRISRKVSQSAAMNVIKTHRSGSDRVRTSDVIGHSNTKTDMRSSDGSAVRSTMTVVENLDGLNISRNDNTNSDGGVVKQHNHDGISHINDSRLRQRFHAYPGRPQLLKLSSNIASKDVECESKYEKFTNILDAPLLNLIALKELSWSGIPRKMRAVTWRLLSGYLPTSLERRNTVLERKRVDYQKLVQQYFHVDNRDETQQDTYRQIHIDVPRMNPHVSLFQQHLVQEMFERILFIWAIRHPASGYVQGINDLVTPFFIVFLQESVGADKDLEQCQLGDLPQDQRDVIEADAFWCLSKFLDCIQDNYIFAQLGIQEKVNQLKELIQRIDGTLHRHLQSHGVDYLQFSFRWMNNLLTRELPLYCTIRLWDTYLAESDGFAVFQLYVCAAFLLHWREQLLQEKDFQGLMLLLQNLPTHSWMDSHIGVLVAEAFRLKFTYADTPKHLEGKS